MRILLNAQLIMIQKSLLNMNMSIPFKTKYCMLFSMFVNKRKCLLVYNECDEVKNFYVTNFFKSKARSGIIDQGLFIYILSTDGTTKLTVASFRIDGVIEEIIFSIASICFDGEKR